MAIVSEPVQRVRAFRNAVPLAVLSAAVVLVVFGLARGMWVSNLHNGLLALAFSAVGAHLVVHQPSHRLGHLFLLTGIAEAVMFWGRQVGHEGGLDELAGSGHQLSVGVEPHGGPVEHELVLPAHLVDVDERA